MPQSCVDLPLLVSVTSHHKKTFRGDPYLSGTQADLWCVTRPPDLDLARCRDLEKVDQTPTENVFALGTIAVHPDALARPAQAPTLTEPPGFASRTPTDHRDEKLIRAALLSLRVRGSCITLRGSMARLYHSASSDALGRRCERAWFFKYVARITEPRVAWADIAHYVAGRDGKTWHDPADASRTVASRDRSTALGTEMHARLEARYRGRPVDWHDLPGSIALSGLHFLPEPARAQTLVEHPIGQAAIVGATEDHAPPVGFRVAGVLWAGYRDLVARAPEEHERLKIPSPLVLYDYKSSSDIARYALSSDALRTDFAANLYALATCEEFGLDAVPARWVYFETKRRRYAEPRDAVITRSSAFGIVAAGSERARALDRIEREDQATPNLAACDDYGGCPYRQDLGGPCRAQRSFGQLMQARVIKKDGNMALPAGITQLAQPSPANGAGPQFAPQFAPPPAADTAPPQFAAPPPTAAPAPPPEAPKRTRAPKAAPAPVQTAAPAPTGDVYEFDVDGNFGPLTLRGDARDVITAAKMLRGATG